MNDLFVFLFLWDGEKYFFETFQKNTNNPIKIWRRVGIHKRDRFVDKSDEITKTNTIDRPFDTKMEKLSQSISLERRKPFFLTDPREIKCLASKPSY